MNNINDRNIKVWSTIGSRATFGMSMLEIAKDINNLMVLTCDVSTSAGLDRFRKNLGNIIQAYQEVARRLGIMPEETNISEVNFGKTIPIKFKKK